MPQKSAMNRRCSGLSMSRPPGSWSAFWPCSRPPWPFPWPVMVLYPHPGRPIRPLASTMLIDERTLFTPGLCCSIPRACIRKLVLAVFEPFAAELISHAAKEEQVLFPLITWIESGDVPPTPFVLQPIKVMEAEHGDAGRALSEMRRLTGGYAVPADGCNTYRAAM